MTMMIKADTASLRRRRRYRNHPLSLRRQLSFSFFLLWNLWLYRCDCHDHVLQQQSSISSTTTESRKFTENSEQEDDSSTPFATTTNNNTTASPLPTCAVDQNLWNTTVSSSVDTNDRDNEDEVELEEDLPENQSNTGASLDASSSFVHEITMENWNRVLESYSFVLVLFHDGEDPSSKVTKQKRILEQLSALYQKYQQQPEENENTNRTRSVIWKHVQIGFARVDTRQHHVLRFLYAPVGSRRGLGQTYDDYYTNYRHLKKAWSPIPKHMIRSETFMNMKTNVNNSNNNKPSLTTSSSKSTKAAVVDAPHFPSHWMLFHCQNVLEHMRDDEDYTLVVGGTTITMSTFHWPSVKIWLRQSIQKHVHFVMQGLSQSKFPFAEMEPDILYASPHVRQREARTQYEAENPMQTSIDWAAADRMAQQSKPPPQQQEMKNKTMIDDEDDEDDDEEEEEKDDPSTTAATSITSSTTWIDPLEQYLRQMQKEWYQKRKNANRHHNKNNDNNDMNEEEMELFYKDFMTATTDNQYDAEIMGSLTDLFEQYFVYADSYEHLWDEERKAREDLQTGYGQYLQILNERVHELLFSTYDEMRDKDNESPFFTADDIPNLEAYFRDLVFGYGRSASSLQQYLEEYVYGLTDDIAHYEEDAFQNVALFQRIREYMKVREDVSGENGNEKRYNTFFKSIWIQLYANLAEFQTNLSRHYVQFQRHVAATQATNVTQQDEMLTQSRFPFVTPDVIDMKDPQNFQMLSDYDEFERRYTVQRKPVVLSNVALTTTNWTVDYLVETCGFIDVTESVKKSHNLHEQGIDEWGGLTDFELPIELMTEQRRAILEDEEEDDDDAYSLSLEQFVALAERLDHLYLHDYSIWKKCAALFNDKSPYDQFEQQHFRIPSVIGSYDLLQRVGHSPYMYSWPSLFIGRKGSNSKLHVDSGATGFWMYLVSGRKRWVVYDEAERPFLYEAIHGSSFVANVLMLHSTPNVTRNEKINDFFDVKFPLLNRPHSESKGYEFVQEAGQLIFIPPNSPHAVENLDDIVGIAFNLVPRAGVAKHIHHMIHSTRYFAAIEITFRYLLAESNIHSRFAPTDTFDPLYTTLGEYMAQS